MVCLLVVLSIGVYVNSVGGDFVSDDIPIIVENPLVRNLGGSILTFRLQSAIYALLFAAFGLNPIPFHILSLALHALIVVLVFVFVTLVANRRVGVITSALFAVHPINTEAVAWISGNTYLFITASSLLVLIFYLLYSKYGEPRYLFYSLLVHTLSVLFVRNIWLLTVPFLVIVADQFMLLKVINPRRLVYVLPFVFPSLLLLLLLVSDVSTRISEVGLGGGYAPFFVRVPYTIFMTVKLLVFPKDLTFYHEGEVIDTALFFLMILVTISYAASILIFLRKNIVAAGGLLFIIAAILPSLSPVQVAWFIAERYLYIAAIPFAILTALGVLAIEKRFGRRNLAVALAGILAILYSAATFVRNSEWRTPKSLWEATARVSPMSPRVHNNLGDVYGKEGDFNRAVGEFETAIELQTDYADAYHNLGNTHLQAGNLDLAKVYLEKSLEINPYLYQAATKLGVIAFRQKNYDAARAYMQKTLEINPGAVDAVEAIRVIDAAKRASE